jgi:hypothetical protein
MSNHETPQRETYPLVSHDDTLMMVFRDHITPNARPFLFVKALVDAQIRVDSAPDVDAKPAVRVIDFAKGAGDTITLTVNGAPTVLTEGANFLAATSDIVTAASIAAAITSSAAGVTAQRVGEVVYVVPGATVTSLTLASSDPEAWSVYGFTTPGTPQTLVSQQTVRIDLPVSAAPLDKVSILNVLSGKVSADLRSMIPVRSYLRQPYTLRATTGHSGGWPVGS